MLFAEISCSRLESSASILSQSALSTPWGETTPLIWESILLYVSALTLVELKLKGNRVLKLHCFMFKVLFAAVSFVGNPWYHTSDKYWFGTCTLGNYFPWYLLCGVDVKNCFQLWNRIIGSVGNYLLILHNIVWIVNLDHFCVILLNLSLCQFYNLCFEWAL